jgi:DoxX-like protein
MVTLLSLLLAAAIAYSAGRKLTHEPEVVASYALAGVPEERLNLLAAVLFAGAAGLLAGLAWEPVGVAAAAALAVYFAVAVGFHVRNGDAAHLATPLVLALLAAAIAVLRLA